MADPQANGSRRRLQLREASGQHKSNILVRSSSVLDELCIIVALCSVAARSGTWVPHELHGPGIPQLAEDLKPASSDANYCCYPIHAHLQLFGLDGLPSLPISGSCHRSSTEQALLVVHNRLSYGGAVLYAISSGIRAARLQCLTSRPVESPQRPGLGNLSLSMLLAFAPG